MRYLEIVKELSTKYKYQCLYIKQGTLNIEAATRTQAPSKIWFIYRASRVTATTFKSATYTDLSQPSQSLLKTISHPDRYKFTTQATKWGCEHEKTARIAYIANTSNKRSNMTVSRVGLIIHPKLSPLWSQSRWFN